MGETTAARIIPATRQHQRLLLANEKRGRSALRSETAEKGANRPDLREIHERVEGVRRGEHSEHRGIPGPPALPGPRE